jgi:hypothetical protein
MPGLGVGDNVQQRFASSHAVQVEFFTFLPTEPVSPGNSEYGGILSVKITAPCTAGGSPLTQAGHGVIEAAGHGVRDVTFDQFLAKRSCASDSLASI